MDFFENILFCPALTGSKNPISKVKNNEKVRLRFVCLKVLAGGIIGGN